jgi:hypothetical protein
LLRQAIRIISREASQLVTQVSGEAAHEKRHEEDARRFAGGQVGEEGVHEVSGTCIAEGGMVMHEIRHFRRCFAVGGEEAIFEEIVAVCSVWSGAVEDIGDGVESHGGEVGYDDVVAVNLGCNVAAAKNGLCLIKPKRGTVDIECGQFNVFQSGDRGRRRRWIEERGA